MYNNLSTDESIDFLISYFEEKNISTFRDSWIIKKKYKNIFGHICRDFYNQYFPYDTNKKCIVVFNPEISNIQVIEDADESFFLQEAARLPIFIYIPMFYDGSIIFHFEPFAIFARNKTLSNPANYDYLNLLHNKLNSLFKKENVQYLSHLNKFKITNLSVNIITKILDTNKFEFNNYLFDFFDVNEYQLVSKDIDFITYTFSEYDKFTEDESFDYLMNMLSSKEHNNFSNKDYSEIIFLLKKLQYKSSEMMFKITQSLDSFKNPKVAKYISDHYNNLKNEKLALEEKSKKR